MNTKIKQVPLKVELTFKDRNRIDTVEPNTLLGFYEEIDDNSLKNFMKSEMTLYGINGFCFMNKNDLLNYCNELNINMENMYELNYFSFFGGKNDVIKKTDINGENYYKAKDKDNYLEYVKESINFDKHLWKIKKGDISNYYKMFRDKGITFVDDVYEKKENIFSKVKRKIKK